MTKPHIGLGTVVYLFIYLGYYGASGYGGTTTTKATPTTSPSVTCYLPSIGDYVVAHQDNEPVNKNRIFYKNEVVYFKCLNYYILVGSSLIKCLSDGYWSQYPPTCESPTTVKTTTEPARPCQVPFYTPPLVAINQQYKNVPSGSSISSGESISYFCSNRLTPIGNTRITCNAGYWSDEPPTCPKPCPEPDVIDYGILVDGFNGPYLPGSEIKFECLEGYLLKGEHKLTCLSSGDWSFDFPTCINAYHCGEIPSISNGFFQPPTTRPGSLVHYFCHSGFKLVGAAHRQCQYNGYFDSEAPYCKDNDECKDYPCHQHATCTNKAPGFECECNDGFVGDGYTCNKLACYPPHLSYHLTFEEAGQAKYEVDQVIHYVCKAGYTLEGYGYSTAKCKYDGSWFPSTLPTCKDVDECKTSPCHKDADCTNKPESFTCECRYGFVGDGFHCRRPQCNPPYQINNGDFSPKPNPVTFGQAITFYCFPGYKIEGEETIHCLIDGNWDHNQPQCVDKNECDDLDRKCHVFAKCENNPGSFTCKCKEGYEGDGYHCQEIHSVCYGRPVPDHATADPVKNNYDLYDFVNYRCNVGFEILGEAHSFCLSGGAWSSNPPTCQNKNECLNNPCGDKAQCHNTIGSFECSCQQDHYMDEYENCVLVECIRPQPGLNGIILPPNRHQFRLNERITYSCKPGYRLVLYVPDEAKCQSDGWSNNPSDCVDINECQQLYICGDSSQCKNTEGSFKCICDSGYHKIDGICKLPSCSQRSAPEHGSVTTTDSTWQVGAVATFTCKKGFTLSGSRQITCVVGASGYSEWDKPDPKCKDFDECELSTPCPKDTFCKNTIGSFHCICEPGFILDPYGFCKPIGCPRPRVPDNGRIIPNDKFDFEQGDIIQYECDQSFTLQGSKSATCQQDGRWSNPEPHCIRDQITSNYCTVSGDPHYNTFDNLKYGFQGPCSYTLVAVTESGLAAGLSNLVIVTENEFRHGLTHVTWLKKVFIHFNGNTIELRKHQIVLLNGITTELPIDIYPIYVSAVGRTVKVTINDIHVQYDGDHFLKVGLPSSYRNKVEGLCGNYNGISNDDLRIAGTNQIATEIDIFGNSWQTNPEQCSPSVHPGNQICERRHEYEELCAIIKKPHECFLPCHGVYDPIEHFENCVYDLCGSNGDRSSLANSIGAYALKCQLDGVKGICNWRQVIQYDMQCGPHSTYTTCASACPPTCYNRSPEICLALCIEGCECDDGYILSGTECVLPENCGCSRHGVYHKSGAQFYTPGCTEYCHCENGEILCDYKPCGHGEKCVPDEYGILYCKAPAGTCVDKPLDKYIRIPKSCDDGAPINVGECPSSSCPTGCCGPVDSYPRTLHCYGLGEILVYITSRCSCVPCRTKIIKVVGHVIEFQKVYAPNVAKLSGIHIKRDGILVAETDQDGHFELEVPHDVIRLVLTFFDSNNEYVITTKVLAFNKFGGEIFHKIQLLRKEPVVEKHSSTPATFHLGEHRSVLLQIQPSSYFQRNGQSYSGKVFCRVTLIDPKVPGHLDAASGDFTAEDGTSLRSYGMIDIDITDEYNSPLEIKNVKIELQASYVENEDDKRSMRLWSMDPYSGYWIFERDAHFNRNNYGVEVFGSQFEIGLERRQFNFDVPARKTCFAKVRVFASSAFLGGEQLTGAKITLTGADLVWRSGVSAISKPRTGACLQTYCDGGFPGRFEAEHGHHHPLFPAAAVPDISGLSQAALYALYYSENGKVSVVSLPNGINIDYQPGPFYDDEYSCFAAPFEDNHFRFFEQTRPMFEFNAIFFDDYNIFFSWQSHPLSWYPSVEYGFQACYAKVNYVSPFPFEVFAASFVDTPQEQHAFVGTREDLIVGSPDVHWSACLEFKCSLPGSATTVLINSNSRCVEFYPNYGLIQLIETRNVANVGPVVHMTLANEVGPHLGIYSAHAADPVSAKKIARASCYAGVGYADPKHVERITLDQKVIGTFQCNY